MLLSLCVTVGDGEPRYFTKEVDAASPEAIQRAVRVAVDDCLHSYRREVKAAAGKRQRADRAPHPSTGRKALERNARA